MGFVRAKLLKKAWMAHICLVFIVASRPKPAVSVTECDRIWFMGIIIERPSKA